MLRTWLKRRVRWVDWDDRFDCMEVRGPIKCIKKDVQNIWHLYQGHVFSSPIGLRLNPESYIDCVLLIKSNAWPLDSGYLYGRLNHIQRIHPMFHPMLGQDIPLASNLVTLIVISLRNLQTKNVTQQELENVVEISLLSH